MLRPSSLPALLLLLPLAACSPGEASSPGAPGSAGDAPGASGEAPAADYSESQLRFENRAIDLGEILQHEEHPLEFPFRVEGPDPVVITEVAPSCGCTDIRVEVDGEPYILGSPIRPQASGRIFGMFESGTFKELKKTDITLRGNALDMPLKLDVQALIRPIFVLSPKQVLFGEVPARRGAEREVVVSAVKDFVVERWVNSPAGFLIEEVGEAEPAPDGQRVLKRFRIQLLPEAETRRHYGSFVAETSLGRRLEIVLQANVFGPVRYQPDQRLTFGMMNKGDTPVRRVQVRAMAGEPIPEPIVELLDSELFLAEVSAREPGQAYVVKVSISGDAPLGTHAARLRISYPEEADLPEQELAVSAIVRDRR